MEFLKKNFNAIAGWASIIALITAAPLGFFFWWWGRETQEPIFYVGAQSILVDQNSVDRAPISILDSNEQRVKGNVILTKFYFWNNGKKPIVFEEDVIKSADTGEQEIYVYLTGDEEARILSNSCTPVVNPEYTGFKKVLEQIDTNRLRFTFNVVRHLEGISCQVIFEGKKTTNIEMEGALLEVSDKINSEASLARLRGTIWKRRIFNTNSLIIPAFLIGGAGLGMVILAEETTKNKSVWSFTGYILGMSSLGIIVIVGLAETNTYRSNKTTVRSIEVVPKELRRTGGLRVIN